MPMLRPLIARASFAVVVVALAALLAIPSAEARTKVVHYTPFASDGTIKHQLHAIHRSGDCSSSSFVDPARKDAWRCFTGSFIRDPCFESPVFDDEVACVAAPWGHRAIV